MPSSPATRSMARVISQDFEPSSIAGRRWQWMSINSFLSGGTIPGGDADAGPGGVADGELPSGVGLAPDVGDEEVSAEIFAAGDGFLVVEEVDDGDRAEIAHVHTADLIGTKVVAFQPLLQVLVASDGLAAGARGAEREVIGEEGFELGGVA